MGCLISLPTDGVGGRRRPGNIGEVSVFVPGLRIPKPVDLSESLCDELPTSLLERLSALRTRIVVLAMQEDQTITRTKRKSGTQYGSNLSDLLQALDDYLPVLLGLVKDGSSLQRNVQFIWLNQEDEKEETAMFSAWYEVLSVLHLMATLSLFKANFMILPRTYADGHQPKISEENRKSSVDVFLKAAGYLDCAIRQVLPQFPTEVRRSLPVDLAEGNLRALCLQALAQGVDIQLGLAIDSTKATLAVKRRLACEMVKYWQQAQDNIISLPLSNGWGEKHKLFVKWRHIEAKAAAYYYHGLILDEGNTERSHNTAVAALQAADEYLKESDKASEAFNAAVPTSRNPPLSGTMKYLSEKIPKDTSSKVPINKDLYTNEKIMEIAPTLPDFSLALTPDEYQLPPLDSSWNGETKSKSSVGANKFKE